MLNLISAVVLAISLTGCHQVVNSWDIERAIQTCRGLENVVEITSVFDGREFVVCKTNKQYSLD